MKFEEAFHNFRNELLKEYGPDAKVIEMCISGELYEYAIIEFTETAKYTDFKPSSTDFNMYGTKVVSQKFRGRVSK